VTPVRLNAPFASAATLVRSPAPGAGSRRVESPWIGSNETCAPAAGALDDELNAMPLTRRVRTGATVMSRPRTSAPERSSMGVPACGSVTPGKNVGTNTSLTGRVLRIFRSSIRGGGGGGPDRPAPPPDVDVKPY